MLLDTHTNLMWYPDHLSDEFVRFDIIYENWKQFLPECV